MCRGRINTGALNEPIDEIFDSEEEKCDRELLVEVLPADMQNVDIDYQHTEKLQNGSYDGMVIRPEGQPIGMINDLNLFFSEYENGTSYNTGEQTASIYTADKAVMRRFDRLVADIQSSISGWSRQKVLRPIPCQNHTSVTVSRERSVMSKGKGLGARWKPSIKRRMSW